jgi:SnoaL-like domain
MTQAGDTIYTMLHAIDSKDWDGVRRTFADTLEMDYRSLFGDPAATVDADSQVAAWRGFAGAFDVTQHITGPIVVTPTAGGAIARTHVRAYHRIQGAPGGDVWMVAGHYSVTLVRSAESWRIAGITLTVFYQEGNLGIPQIARARASASRTPDA